MIINWARTSHTDVKRVDSWATSFCYDILRKGGCGVMSSIQYVVFKTAQSRSHMGKRSDPWIISVRPPASSNEDKTPPQKNSIKVSIMKMIFLANDYNESVLMFNLSTFRLD